MEIIENLKLKSKLAKNSVKDKISQLVECIENIDCLDVDNHDDLVCMIDKATSKAKSKMRKQK